MFIEGTGLRESEASGAEFADLDIKNLSLYVKYQVVEYSAIDSSKITVCNKGKVKSNGKYKIERLETKSDAGKRPIPLMFCQAFLRDIVIFHNIRVPRAKTKDIADCIFINKDGGYMCPGTLSRFLAEISSDKANEKAVEDGHIAIPHISPHMLRYRFTTKLINAGLSKDMIVKIVGHSCFDTTIKYYYKIADKELIDKANKYIVDYMQSKSPERSNNNLLMYKNSKRKIN